MQDEEDAIDQEELPIYRKGKEIFDVLVRIDDLIPEKEDNLQIIKAQMISDAVLLTVKVASAESGELSDIKMEAAAIIRKDARDLMITNHSLEMFGFEHVEYFQIVRNLIEDYRLLFINWVASFDKWN